MSNTDLKIKKLIRLGNSDERIAAKLGRPMSLDLAERIARHRKDPSL